MYGTSYDPDSRAILNNIWPEVLEVCSSGKEIFNDVISAHSRGLQVTKGIKSRKRNSYCTFIAINITSYAVKFCVMWMVETC